MRKVGDSVKIRSKEWIDAQPKSSAWGGAIDFSDDIGTLMVEEMFCYAGKDAKIEKVLYGDGLDTEKQTYLLDIDNSGFDWIDEMFEPEGING